jgi:hypothetical protein
VEKNKANLQADLLRELVEKAQLENLLLGKTVQRRPGEIVQSLGPVKRQFLKKLEPKDIENDRWPR